MIAAEEWGPLPTTVDSPTQCTVSIPAVRSLDKPVVAHLYIRNPGGTRSDLTTDLTSTFNPPAQLPAPTLTSISQSNVATPTASFTFTVTGTNFVASTSDGHDSHTVVSAEEWANGRLGI